MKKFDLRFVCTMSMGIVLYVVLSLAVQVPIFQNYYICLGYLVLSLFAWYYGPAGGALTGTFGCVLYCILTSGLRGMPGWTLGNLFIGIALGYGYKLLKKKANVTAVTAGVILAVLTSAVGILGLKSFVEVFIRSQPMLLRMTTNFAAFVSDAVVLSFGVPFCLIMKEPMNRVLKENGYNKINTDTSVPKKPEEAKPSAKPDKFYKFENGTIFKYSPSTLSFYVLNKDNEWIPDNTISRRYFDAASEYYEIDDPLNSK